MTKINLNKAGEKKKKKTGLKKKDAPSRNKWREKMRAVAEGMG